MNRGIFPEQRGENSTNRWLLEYVARFVINSKCCIRFFPVQRTHLSVMVYVLSNLMFVSVLLVLHFPTFLSCWCLDGAVFFLCFFFFIIIFIFFFFFFFFVFVFFLFFFCFLFFVLFVYYWLPLFTP